MQNLEPKLVWQYFDQITKIPRPSKKEDKILDYLRKFAHEHSFEFRQDPKGNAVIVRPASIGFEAMPLIILQNHVDMVCEKEPGLEFDFEKDPIQTYIADGWVRARGTTLGADCGIGMALAMAALTSPEIKGPAIEALFTVDEEQGLSGAMELGQGLLTGHQMINLDSEDEGEIFIGCAGGIDTIATFDYEPKANDHPKDFDYFSLEVHGLHGGHSGDDINRGYANANKILNRLLWELLSNAKVRLSWIDGGNLRNAIARDAVATVAIPKEDTASLSDKITVMIHDLKREFAATETEMTIEIRPAAQAETFLDKDLTKTLVAALQATPHGVISMSRAIDGLVETSTNLASVKITGDKITIATLQRSSVESAKRDIALTVESVFRLAGAAVRHTDGYPGWAPNPSSPLLAKAVESYRRLFGVDPQIKAIHAGLECGLFLSKYPELDMISIGPTLRGVHSPAERLEIAAVPKLWALLAALING